MVRGGRVLPRIVQAVCLVVILLAGLVFFARPVDSTASTVQLNVPDATLTVQGKASPEALVIVYSDNKQVSTTVADTGGEFKKSIKNLEIGIQTISIEQKDVSGVLSSRYSKQVAINLQQNTALDVFLPSTVSVAPNSQVFGKGFLEFSGYSVPHASVRVAIDNGADVLEAKANSQGLYVIKTASSRFAVGAHSYRVSALNGSDYSELDNATRIFFITAPVPAPIIVPTLQPANSSIPVPEILAPQSATLRGNEPFFIEGIAIPGAEILIYDDGQLIGATLSSPEGTWQFYFQPVKPRHLLSAQACLQTNCSERTEHVAIQFENLQEDCTLDFRLDQYRIADHKKGDPVPLSGSGAAKNLPLLALIAWGDQTEEQFDLTADAKLSAEHVYAEPGIYNGTVSVSTNAGCSSVAYFTVNVDEDSFAAKSIATLAVFAGGFVVFGLITIRKYWF